MIDTLLSLLAPHLCISCGRIGLPLCVNCKYDIITAVNQTCLTCGGPRHLMNASVCDGSWYVGFRKAALQRLIGSFKFNGMRACLRPLVSLLNDAALTLPKDTIITWIPTHPKHVRERGYDHMKLIAYAFAKRRRLNARLVLSRQFYFIQHRSNRATRLEQVKGAFATTRQFEQNRIYVLLDDIYTTGATVAEAAVTLKAAGAAAVIIGIIARQPLD